MNLATVFLYDGEYEKALAELEKVNKRNLSYDEAKYLSIKGLVYLKQGNYEEAARTLEQSVAATRTKKYKFDRNVDQERVRMRELEQLNMHLAESLYYIEDCNGVLDALDAAGEVALSKPQLYAVRADCSWRTNYKDNAINLLNDGYRKFPDAIDLMKQKYTYYVQGGLYTAAADLAVELLKEDDLTDGDYLSLAKSLDNAGQTDRAIDLLHEAKLKFANNPQIPLFLGHLFLKKNMTYAAVGVFEQAAAIDNTYSAEVAEIYRRGGLFQSALRWNSQITNVSRKLMQQVAIFIELEEFERVIALRKYLDQNALLEDDNVAYALAYSHFRLREFDKAEALLSSIQGSEIYAKAIAVRQSIATCLKNLSTCE